jgi:hypothetical protein
MKALRQRGRGLIWSACAIGLASSTTSLADAAPANAAPPALALELVSQELAVPADAALLVGFSATSAIPPEATIVVTSYQRITDRGTLKEALDGKQGRAIDTLDFPATTLATTATGTYELTIPTEASLRTATALELPAAGLYPLIISIQIDKQVLATLRTVAYRLPLASEPVQDTLQVALVAALSTPPVLPGQDTALSTGVLASVQQLIKLKESTLFSLSVSADVLERLPVDLLEQLRPALQRSELLSQPHHPLDPSVAAAAGQQALFQAALVEGEDLIAAIGETRQTNRAAWIADQTLSTAGAEMLRLLNVRGAVLTPEAFAQADNSLGPFTDTSQVVEAVLGNGSLRLAVIDSYSADRLEDPIGSFEQRALFAAADLVVKRDELAETGLRGHTIFVGSRSLAVPDIDLINRIVEMTTAAGAIKYLTLSEALSSTNQLALDGLNISVTLPDISGEGLQARVDQIAEVHSEAVADASMLAPTDSSIGTWFSTLSLLTSTAIDDATAGQAIAGIRTQLDELRACIEPPGAFAFTLSGTTTSIPVTLRNTCDRTLNVKVRVTSSKMTFPDGDQIVELAPNAATDVAIAAAAQSNGSFGVELQLLTPAPDDFGREALVGEPVTLRARVNALTGLAQVLTGGGLLVVLTWWLKNARNSRRKRALAEVGDAHPSRHDQITEMNPGREESDNLSHS